MKKSAITLALALGVSAWSAMAQEQDSPSPGDPVRPAGRERGPGAPRGPGDSVRPEGFHLLPPRVQQQLDLTPDQQKELANLEAKVKRNLAKLLTPDQIKELRQMRPPLRERASGEFRRPAGPPEGIGREGQGPGRFGRRMGPPWGRDNFAVPPGPPAGRGGFAGPAGPPNPPAARGQGPGAMGRPAGPPAGFGARGWRAQRPFGPLIAALDCNRDGIIEPEEIARASESLKTLDKNGDGELTSDELRPLGPFGPAGTSGRGGPQFRGGRGGMGGQGGPGWQAGAGRPVGPGWQGGPDDDSRQQQAEK